MSWNVGAISVDRCAEIWTVPSMTDVHSQLRQSLAEGCRKARPGVCRRILLVDFVLDCSSARTLC